MKRLSMLAALLLAAPAVAQDFPARTNSPVNDAANIIPDDREEALVKRLREIEAKGKNPIVVLTVPSLDGYSIADYGQRAFRHYGIGHRDKDNGVLITVAPNDRKVRIDVGYGLEVMLTDADAAPISEAMAKEYFKAGDYPGGIDWGVEQVAEEITPLTPAQIELQQREIAAQKQRAAAAWASFVDFLVTALMVVGILGALLFLFLVFIVWPRKRAQEARMKKEIEERQAALAEQRAVEAAAREARRVREADERRIAQEEERKREAARIARIEAQEREAREAREAMLAAMTPYERQSFLAEEKRAEQERERIAEKRRMERAEAARIADEAARVAAAEARARREKESRERAEKDAKDRRDREERSRRSNDSWGSSYGSSSSSSSSSWGSSSSSSSSSSDSYGGGDSGGGGSDSSW